MHWRCLSSVHEPTAYDNYLQLLHKRGQSIISDSLKKLINVLKTCSNIKLHVDKKHYEADYAVELAKTVLIPLFHE